MKYAAAMAVLALACETKTAPPAPPVPSAPAPPAAPESYTVADVVFEADQLSFCDEITRTSDEWARLLPPILAKAGAKKNEKIKERATCADVTGGRAEQATCTQPGFVRFFYSIELVDRNDVELKKCLDRGGAWKVNDSLEAHQERARQHTNLALTPQPPEDGPPR